MRISLVYSDYPPRLGGIATLNRDLAYALADDARVAQVEVSVFSRNEHSDEEPKERLVVRQRPMRSILLLGFDMLRALLFRPRADVYHSTNLFPVAFFTLIAAKILRRPCVVAFHGTDALEYAGSTLTLWAKEWTLKRANARVALSQSTKRLVAERWGIHEAAIDVIPYAQPAYVPHEAEFDAREKYGYAKDDLIVLAVCQLVERKGVEDLIRAVASISDPRVKLLVVGDGPDRPRLEEITDAVGARPRVVFAGRLSNPDSFYHAADIFALTSFYKKKEGDVEGLGIVMLEAAQHSLPVIGSDSGGVPETFLPGESGILVPERDPAAIAAAIERLAGDPALRMRMGEAGKRFVAEKFDGRKIADAYIGVYERCMKI